MMIDSLSNCLSPYKVKELKDLGVDTSDCLLYWQPMSLLGKTFYEVHTKDIFPFELQEGDEDAPTYLELKSLLPESIDKDGKIYMLVEFKVNKHTIIQYKSMFDILFSTEKFDACEAVYDTLKWIIENKYGNKED